MSINYRCTKMGCDNSGTIQQQSEQITDLTAKLEKVNEYARAVDDEALLEILEGK